jgi:hypothetical protein
VFDVYITREWKVWLLDFAPFVKSIESLLFTWDELLSLCHSNQKEETNQSHFLSSNNNNNNNNNNTFPNSNVVLRLVNQTTGRMQPNITMMASRFPIELSEMTLEDFIENIEKWEEKTTKK